MVKGFHVAAFKAGLLALTALASAVPALAQERGNWGGRAGMERSGGGERGGGAREGGWQRGNGQGGGVQAGGGENRGWRDNGAATRPAPQAGGQIGGQAGAQADTRNWRGDSNARWQNRTPRADATPTPRPDLTPGTSAGFGQPQAGDRNNWRNGNAGRNDGNRGWNDENRNDGNRNGANRWNNDRAGNGYTNGTINRAYGNQGVRQNDGNRNYARPNNGWQGNNGWQAGNGRINSNDRWRDQARWNRDWRRDNRYDWSGYRQYNRNVYRLPAYQSPFGWNSGYSRFSIGVYLGGPLFGSSYWIDDPYSYRLPEAYGTMRWIRYYDDALLVDIRDGYVVDVLHDFFW